MMKINKIYKLSSIFLQATISIKDIHFENSDNIEVNPIKFVEDALLSNDKQVFIMAYNSEGKYVGGIDFNVIGDKLPKSVISDGWFWPSNTMEERFFDHRKPRYKDLSSAIIESAKMNDYEAIYIYAKSRVFYNFYTIGIRVRPHGWFDDPDYLIPGTIKVVWKNYFNKAKITKPFLWKGDDDSML